MTGWIRKGRRAASAGDDGNPYAEFARELYARIPASELGSARALRVRASIASSMAAVLQSLEATCECGNPRELDAEACAVCLELDAR